jgi:glycosyltransferase 2 family protein
MGRWLKVTVSAALVAVLAAAVDWPSVPEHLEHVHLSAALLVIVAYALQLFISAWKWQWALVVHELQLPFRYLSRVYWIGFFLNNFLPSSIGGDAYRIYKTIPNEGFRSRALSAVILERLVGMAVLMVFGVLGAVALADRYTFAGAFLTFVTLGTVAAASILLALKLPSLAPLLHKLAQHPWLQAVAHNVELLTRARSAYIPLIAISVLFQAIAIAINYALFALTGEPISIAHCALITAVAGLATVIPLSINGIGVLEGAFAGTAIALGVNYEQALLVAILIRVLVLPLSLIAGAIYACESKAVPNLKLPETTAGNVRPPAVPPPTANADPHTGLRG